MHKRLCIFKFLSNALCEVLLTPKLILGVVYQTEIFEFDVFRVGCVLSVTFWEALQGILSVKGEVGVGLLDDAIEVAASVHNVFTKNFQYFIRTTVIACRQNVAIGISVSASCADVELIT